MKEDRALQSLLRSVDTQITPPEGLKERIFGRVIQPQLRLSPAERFFFAKPLRAACAIAVPVTAALWAVTGGNFIGLLSGLIH